MRHATPEQLEQAFADAANAPRDRRPVHGTLASHARRALDLRREALAAEPCPAPVLRKVQGWFAARPRNVAQRLLALVFDSGTSAVPAVRGALPALRTFRYAADGATVDVQVRGAASEVRTLHFAVNPVPPRLEVRVRAGRSGPAKRMALDSAGTGEMRLPGKVARVDASFHVAGVESFRITGLRLA